MVSQNNGAHFLMVSFTPDPLDFFLKYESCCQTSLWLGQQYAYDYVHLGVSINRFLLELRTDINNYKRIKLIK